MDVRHRPVRLPMDRRRRASAAPAPSDRGGGAGADRLDQRDLEGSGARGRGRRRHRAALPDLGACVTRGTVSHRPSRRIHRSAGGRCRHHVAHAGEAAAARCQVQDPADRCTERERRAGSRVSGEDRRQRGRRHRRVSRADRTRRRTRRSMSFDPGPEGSIGDLSWVIEARRSGQASAVDRAGRAPDASGAGRGHRSAGSVLGGEGRRLCERRRAAAGSVPRHRVPGRGSGGLADLRQCRARAGCGA